MGRIDRRRVPAESGPTGPSTGEYGLGPLPPAQHPYNGEFLRYAVPCAPGRRGLPARKATQFMATIAPRTPPLTITDTVDRWTVTDASELYEVPRWGKGYFSVNANGHLQVHPNKDPNLAIDMKDLIERLQLRGLDLPILLRFNGILKDRLREIHDCFAQAIREHDYKGKYACVYPIKVNQQRHVVEQVVQQLHRLRHRESLEVVVTSHWRLPRPSRAPAGHDRGWSAAGRSRPAG